MLKSIMDAMHFFELYVELTLIGFSLVLASEWLSRTFSENVNHSPGPVWGKWLSAERKRPEGGEASVGEVTSGSSGGCWSAARVSIVQASPCVPLEEGAHLFCACVSVYRWSSLLVIHARWSTCREARCKCWTPNPDAFLGYDKPLSLSRVGIRAAEGHFQERGAPGCWSLVPAHVFPAAPQWVTLTCVCLH